MCKALEELGHSQPPTPVHTDNSTAYEVITNKILHSTEGNKSFGYAFLLVEG